MFRLPPISGTVEHTTSALAIFSRTGARGEIAHEQRFSGGAFGVEAAIGHWLAATGLITRVDHLVPEALEQLECRDAHRGKEGIDVARNEQTDTHGSSHWKWWLV